MYTLYAPGARAAISGSETQESTHREAHRSRRRRHLHRPDPRRRRSRAYYRRQGPVHPRRPRPRRRRGHRPSLCEGRRAAVGNRQPAPRHDRRDKHRTDAQGRLRRPDHHRGLPRHSPHRAPQEAAQLLDPAGPPVAGASARQAPPPPRRRRARDRAARRDRHAARRGCRPPRGPPPEGRGRRVRRRLLPALVPQRDARAARGGDHHGGVPRGVPVDLERGHPALPRVRALLDRRAQRVRRPEGLHLPRSLRNGDEGRGLQARRPADAVLRWHGHGRVGLAAPRQPAHVRPRRRPDRRHLGRQDGRLRQRHHARHRRHLGRRGRGRGRPDAHAPPARHEGGRLPGDGADGRHRHHRCRRRLDRLRRRRRRLPRRPAVGRCRPRSRLLRPRRHAADLDGRPGLPRSPAPRARPRRRRPRPEARAGQERDQRTRCRARHVARTGRPRCPADPEVRHDAEHRDQLGAPRLRPT